VTPTTTRTSISNTINTVGNFLDSPLGHTIRTGCNLSYAAGTGVLSSQITRSSLGIFGGAIFGVSGWLVDHCVSWISDKALKAMNLEKNTLAKVVVFAVKFFMTTGACLFAAMLTEFPITFAGAAIMSLSTFVLIPAIKIIVFVSTIAPWLISLVHWLQRSPGVQAVLNEIEPPQDAIDAGANLINDEVLADVSEGTRALFAEMDPSIFRFITAKAIFIYSAGARREEEIPHYFQADTQEAIRILRQQLNDEETIAQIQPFFVDLDVFEGDGPENQEAKNFFNRVRNIASLETQGVSLFNTSCYQRALELDNDESQDAGTLNETPIPIDVDNNQTVFGL